MQWTPLFVYGSLRPGQCNYGELSQAVRRATSARVGGWLRLRPEGYPALTLAPGWPCQIGAPPGHWPTLPQQAAGGPFSWDVEGEVLDLDWTPELGQRLDEFEGFTELNPDYVRVALWTSTGWAWTYVAPQDVPEWPQVEGWPPGHPIRPWVPHQRRE